MNYIFALRILQNNLFRFAYAKALEPFSRLIRSKYAINITPKMVAKRIHIDYCEYLIFDFAI
ncbi:hypothetical protein BIFGAL_03790 [Bifidobacterium gallicum DSM 20093 = LMG 11596]|uniref:Uncharacterized protein n=1 Tax=Bifidobacterium gallicum DSM 20093 = LMG 11596 TaxID=561180 RepID=D1NVA5_9BIFI|nr:hypothetical protein BIFGAL_03790 [Bifidobacterium gallicum DSM 20093 = LMG 11596]